MPLKVNEHGTQGMDANQRQRERAHQCDLAERERVRHIAFQDVLGDVARAEREEQRNRRDDKRAGHVGEEQAHVRAVVRQELLAARRRRCGRGRRRGHAGHMVGVCHGKIVRRWQSGRFCRARVGRKHRDGPHGGVQASAERAWRGQLTPQTNERSQWVRVRATGNTSMRGEKRGMPDHLGKDAAYGG